PAPAAGVPPHAVAVGPGATAIAGADSITLLARNQQTGADQIESLPFPHAADLAVTTTADGQNYQYVLYYRDASGAPQRYVFSQPE
ncbi:MAG: hypothetical protein Q7T55_23975, partial [Solirubrobacteraceae bacterium]|nr:hypothetical protein [Solirubrobacteraceae bacterium]